MPIENATVLITGGLGQVGIAIVQHMQISYPSAQLHVLDLTFPSPPLSHFIPKVTYHSGSITDIVVVAALLQAIKPRVVFHAAGLIPSVAEKLDLNTEEGFMNVNREGTWILLEESKRVRSVRAFVYTSSADVVKGNAWEDLSGVIENWGIPTTFDSFYSKSKAEAETLVLEASAVSFRTVAIRTQGVFSGHDTNLIPSIVAASRSIHLGSGTNLYDFTYAPNLAQAHVLAAINLLTVYPPWPTSAAGKAFFVTNAEPVPFREFVSKVWEAYDGVKSKKGVTVPLKAAQVLVWISEKLGKLFGKRPVMTMKMLGDSVCERWFDNGRAKEFLGYVPVIGLDEGLRWAVEGYKLREMDKEESLKTR